MHSCIVRPRIGDAFMQRAAVNRRCINASCGLKGLMQQSPDYRLAGVYMCTGYSLVPARPNDDPWYRNVRMPIFVLIT